MDKKKLVKSMGAEDIKGFEEFIDSQPDDTSFLPRGVGGSPNKKETGFEHFTFLTNDSVRLTKLKHLLSEKLPFTSRFNQSDKLIKEQQEELILMKRKLFELNDKPGSTYRRSLKEVFDSFFEPPKS